MELGELYRRYRGAVLRITVRTATGTLDTGTCFHIGDGYLVTARHVVEGMEIVEFGDDSGRSTIPLSVSRIVYHSDQRVDLAILGTDLDSNAVIPIGGHLDDWINDDAFITTRVLVMGYPPIPQAEWPVMLAMTAEVVTIIDKYVGSPHPHFVVSSLPRGGFSGGPILSEWELLFGVVTESLVEGGQVLEAGFCVGVSVEPLITMMEDHQILPSGENGDFVRLLLSGGTEAEWMKLSRQDRSDT